MKQDCRSGGRNLYSIATNQAAIITLFHVVMPPLLIWIVHREGYDRGAWPLQCAIALPAFIASRFAPAAQNFNFAFTDPFFHRSWGPAPLHVAIVFLFMALVVYLSTHLLLMRVFGKPGSDSK